jgi:nucleoside-diphosphate-sugar epimerase
MKSAVIAGASGLIGSSLYKILLESSQYDCVHLLVRKKIDVDHPKLVQHVVDFEKLHEQPFDFKVDDAFCTLGTTIAKAGSKTAFIRVDHDYVISFAEMSLAAGSSGFYLVSSMGANPASNIFYNKVKGLVEEDLKLLGFPRLGIFRPSLLLGPRVEKRAGEKFASWMMRALDFMIPAKYKAIHVDQVALRMVEFANREEKGIFVFESDKLQ